MTLMQMHIFLNRQVLQRLVMSITVTGVTLICSSAEEVSNNALSEKQDVRAKTLRNLNGYFPFKPVESIKQWSERKEAIRRRILVSQGLWPMPTRVDINAVIHGRIERDDYTVDRVFFESAPDHYVTGSLYRPKGKRGPFPAVLSPHGHWSQGRFYDAGEQLIEREIQSGAELDEVGGRFPIQARAVQLARMGCVVFVYDMTGNADSVQIEHRPARWNHLDRQSEWGFMSVQADLRLQNMMGLQTWNSLRAVDFVTTLEDVDSNRIGVTGASGGGTQTMILAAIDERISASMPCVMVSTAMQGGCTCENAPLLRIDQGNIDIAAAFAPKPLGLVAADDWTVELQEKGFPDLVHLYHMLGKRNHLSGAFHTEFKHNYNLINRREMYAFFNRHFGLGIKEPIVERYYEPLLREEASVWTEQYPAPNGSRVGDAHEINLLRVATEDSESQIAKIVDQVSQDGKPFDKVIGGGWSTILGRTSEQVGEVRWDGEADWEAASLVKRGQLIRMIDHEQVDFLMWQPTHQSVGVAVLITNGGLKDFETSGPSSTLRDRLLKKNYSVVGCDLLQQSDDTEKKQPMWYQPNGDQGWKRFSGYTYGYNHSLFVKRVHDVLTVIGYLKQKGQDPTHLIGLGQVAGPITVAARSQMGDLNVNMVVDLDDFAFANLKTHDHPMFVPGAVKYLDVDGLLALCAPSNVAVLNHSGNLFPTAQKVYDSRDNAENFFQSSKMDDLIKHSIGE